jgi:hypothetical protein
MARQSRLLDIFVLSVLLLLTGCNLQTGVSEQTAEPILTLPSSITNTPFPTARLEPTAAPVEPISLAAALAEQLDIFEADTQFTIRQEDGAYVKGDLALGGYFLAVEDAAGWMIVYAGQDLPSCADLVSVDFPPDIVPECENTAGELVVRATDDTTAIGLALSKRLDIPFDELGFLLSENTGTYARGILAEGYFLAAKDETGWMIVYDGQATPACTAINPLDFPADMVSECLDANGEPVDRSTFATTLQAALAARLGLPESQLVYVINQETAQHARGTLSQGGYFLAARETRGWLIVYIGQTYPGCEALAPYDFPTDMAPECLDSVGNLVRLGGTVQATPLPTPGPATDPDLPGGAPTWTDTFSNADSWFLYVDDYVGFTVEDGAAVLTAFQDDSWDGWMLSWAELSDFYLEGVFNYDEDCSGLDRAGLVLRQDNPEETYVGYLYSVSCDGRYVLRKWDGTAFTNLIPWTASDLIEIDPDEPVRLGVLADGNRLVLYFDGQKLAESADSSYSEGKFGLLVASENTDDFRVTVDEISYWALPE